MRILGRRLGPAVPVRNNWFAVERFTGSRRMCGQVQMVTLGQNTLGCADVALMAREGAVVALAEEGMTRAAAAHRAAIAAQGPVYGRTTGVGANGAVPVEFVPGNGLRLMRSHASGGGEPVADEAARAMLAVRLNQLAAGGSGADPAWLTR